MTIDKIRSIISNNINKQVNFKINGSRNQVEEFEGKIIKVYNSIFIIRNFDQNCNLSFSYTDILIGNVEIFL